VQLVGFIIRIYLRTLYIFCAASVIGTWAVDTAHKLTD